MRLRIPSPAPDVLGDNVLLSAWTEDDLPAVLEIADDAASRQWSESLRHVRTLGDARAWMARRAGRARRDWAVRDPATGAVIGRTGVMRFHDRPPTAVLGYGVQPAQRRRGVAVAAVAAAFDYGTRELGLHGIELVHAVENVAVEVGGAVAAGVAVRSVDLVDRHASVSYWVLPEHRGRGIAPRALETAARHAYDAVGLHRLQLQHALANTASCRVAERAGFALEPVQRESCLLRGPDGPVFVDEHQHVRLAGS